jgi:SAM-dependent methyltransferase
MKEGERQVAPSIDGIRRDHVARYEFVANRETSKRIIDAACGVGYGSKTLAKTGNRVTAFDKDQEAIDYARDYYKDICIKYVASDLSGGVEFADHDVAVCFETVEHIEDPRPLLKSFRNACGKLYASVPNEDVFPWQNIEFHFRHYTKSEFESLLAECGWKVDEWFGQQGQDSEVEGGAIGRTLIAVCSHREEYAQPIIIEQEADCGNIPNTVCILGLGPSLASYVDLTKRLGNRNRIADEVWGINAVGDVLACDRIFHMDDVRIQQIRSEAAPESNIAAMLEWMKTTKTPIYTSRPHPDYPALIGYPIEAVLRSVRFEYFNSTAAWAVAYAIHIGVKTIRLFGCDFTYANAHDSEKGRGCVEFWLGFAAGKGATISLPRTTSLMDACNKREERIYGYDTVNVERITTDAGLKLAFSERETLPTADEIETAYDHKAHPNPLQVKS